VPLQGQSAQQADPRDPPARKRRWAPTAAVGVLLTIAGTLAWQMHRVNTAKATGTYAPAIGHHQTITLPDGSAVQLNTDSQVQVAYDGEHRRLRLLRGEALFTVAPDPGKPFEVQAANSLTRAIGTAFSVHLEGRQVDVTVTQGTV